MTTFGDPDEYMKKREKNIQKREEFMKSLNIERLPRAAKITARSKIDESDDDEDFTPSEDSSSESESETVVEEELPKKKRRRVQTTTAIVLREVSEKPNFENFFSSVKYANIIMFLANPVHYTMIERVIVDYHHGAIAPMSSFQMFEGKRVLFVSGELIQEALHYFPDLMSCRNVDVHETLAKFGTKLQDRLIPEFFQVCSTTNANTYVISEDIAKYLFARFTPFEETQLREKPAKFKKQGNQTSLNIGDAYDSSRTGFPSCKYRAVVEKMLSNGYTKSLTNFIELVVDRKYTDASSLMGKEFAAKLSVAIESAKVINAKIIEENDEYMSAKSPADRRALRHNFRTRYIPSVGCKSDLPKTFEEWSVCTIFNEDGLMLSNPGLADNNYVSYSKRKRPESKFPFSTMRF